MRTDAVALPFALTRASLGVIVGQGGIAASQAVRQRDRYVVPYSKRAGEEIVQTDIEGIIAATFQGNTDYGLAPEYNS